LFGGPKSPAEKSGELNSIIEEKTPYSPEVSGGLKD